MAENNPNTTGRQDVSEAAPEKSQAAVNAIFKESNLHSILRAKHAVNRDGLKGFFEQRMWTAEPNLLFQLTAKVVKGCQVADYKPGFFEFLARKYFANEVDFTYKDRLQECVTQIENTHYHKFERELISLYECKSKCQEQAKSSKWSSKEKPECFKVCHTTFNMKVRSRVETLTGFLEAGDIESYEKF